MANNDSLSLSHINHMESLYELGRYENLHATALSNFRLASIINQVTEHEEIIEETLKHYQAAISNSFGYTFAGNPWSVEAVQNIHDASELTARAFAHWVENEAKLGSVDRYQLYRRIMGPLEFFNSNEQSSSGAYAETQNHLRHPDGRKIEVFLDEDGQQRVMSVNNVIHELGHLFNGNAGPGGRDGIATINSLAQDLFGGELSRDGMGHPDPSTLIGSVRANTLQQSGLDDNNEIVADAFLNWVYTINTRNQSGFSTIPGLSLKFPKLSELVNSQLEEIPYQFAAGEEWFCPRPLNLSQSK